MERLKGALVKALVAVAGLVLSHSAWAEGTAANTTVTNTVTVDYRIGGVDQPQVQSQASFIVDRKVDVVVAEVGSTDTQVTPGASQQATTFTVTNASNATLDFGLSVEQPNGGTGPRGNTDNFDATSVQIYLDSDGNGTFSAASDTLVTSLDELEPTDTASPGAGTRTLFVVVSIGSGQSNGDVAAVSLTAQAREGGQAGILGAVLTESTGADTAGMDTLFADGGGPALGDGARDGKHSDDDAYVVTVTPLTVTKSVTLVSDPLNGTTNPKAIPGAILEYCLLLANGGSQAVTMISISDSLPSQIAYVAGSMQTGSHCATAASAEDDDSSDGSDMDGFTAAIASGVLTAQVANVGAGGTAAIRFRVELR